MKGRTYVKSGVDGSDARLGAKEVRKHVARKADWLTQMTQTRSERQQRSERTHED